MWECQNCHERHEDTFKVCWNCGTSIDGARNSDFQTADQIDPRTLEPPTHLPVGDPYEFNTEQHRIIAGLALDMKFVGVVSLVGGALLVLAGFALLALLNRTGIVNLIQGVLALIVGGITLRAAGAFRLIVVSPGDDMPHLMAALEALRRLYQLQVFILLIGLGLLTLMLCAILVD